MTAKMRGVQVVVLCFLCVSVQGYVWDWVENANDYHPDTVWHSSTDQGVQAPCRENMVASGRNPEWMSGGCFYGWDGDEHQVGYPFEVVVRDPITENLIWKTTTDPVEIRDNAVVVCMNCNPEPEMYVCAVSHWGPGKLALDYHGRFGCFVAYGGDEHIFYEGYQALIQDPAHQYSLTEVNYYLDDLNVLQDNPLTLAEATVINEDDGVQTVVYTLTYLKTSTNEWKAGVGFTVGTGMSVTAGIPEIFSTGWEISATRSFEYSYGQSHSETIQISMAVWVDVPGRHSCEVSIIGRQVVADVPYDATATIFYPDGTSYTEYISGVYEGLSVSQDQAVIGDCLPLS